MTEDVNAENNTESARTILVTVGASALGQTVIRELKARDYKVYGTAGTSAEADAIRAVGGVPVYPDLSRASEIASTLKMIDARTIINLYPQTFNSVPYRVTAWDGEQLVASAEALAEAASATSVTYIIHTSFAFVYAPSGTPVDEDGKLTADNAIVKSVIDAENAVTSADINACILRTGYVYGPGEESFVALRDQLRTGRPVVSEDHAANWIHTNDLANAILLTMEKQPENTVLNIVDDQPITTREFLVLYGKGLGVGEPSGVPGFLRGMFSNKVATALLATDSRASNARAKDALGWQPKYPTVEVGLDDTLLSWRAGEVTT